MKKIKVELGEELEAREEDQRYHCEVCGREISKEEYESYEGKCWECWDDYLTEETLEDITGDFL